MIWGISIEEGDEKDIPLDDLGEKDITKLSGVTDQPIQPPQQQDPVQVPPQQISQQSNPSEDQVVNNPFQNNFGIKKEGTSSVPQNTKKFSFL